METDNSDKDFLKDAPTLAAISKRNPFVVPNKYFESLNDGLNARITIEAMCFKTEDNFQVPDKYFENLTERIESRIQTEKIKALVPSDGFKVPEAYFSDLKHQIHSRTQADRSPIRKKGILPSWLSYSAAASVAIVTGVFLYFNSTVYNINKKLADIPDQEIINYLRRYTIYH